MLRNIDALPDVQIGDLVFIRLGLPVFRQVAEASNCWSNHVGIVCGHDGRDWIVAESCVPCVRKRSLRAFIARSEHGAYAIRRLPHAWQAHDIVRLQAAVAQRMGTLYHTGFALHSSRQFCSKFVREVLLETLGREVGSIETFADMFAHNPQARLGFWRLWFFGRIPWQRATVTPASLLHCPHMNTIHEHAH